MFLFGKIILSFYKSWCNFKAPGASQILGDRRADRGGARQPLTSSPPAPQGRNLPGHNLPPGIRDHPVESLPGCARNPARTALCSGKGSHGFLQIFILLKSSSLPGVLRLKTTASHSCRKWEYNWHYYLYGDQFSNSDRE